MNSAAFFKNRALELLVVPTRLTAIIAVILALFHQNAGSLPPSVQWLIFTIFITFAGIPHGALDHIIAEETARRHLKPFKIVLFLLKYLGLMLFYGGVWLLFPSLSLIAFLIISAWHFGETDIENAPPTPLWQATRFVFGSFVLLFLLLFHETEVTPILNQMTQSNLLFMHNWQILLDNKVIVCTIVFAIFLMLGTIANGKKTISFDINHYWRLSLILISGYYLPLLVAFGLYFGGWHALCSFKNIQHYLIKNLPENQYQIIRSAINIWVKTILFTAIALLFMVGTLFIWYKFMPEYAIIPPLFIFISLITLPHLIVMHGMNREL